MGNTCGGMCSCCGPCCCGDKRTNIERQVDDCLLMLRTKPNMNRYWLNKERGATFSRAWASTYYGGSVLNPLGAISKRRSRHNPLREQIRGMQINSLHGGGYYVLEKVQLYKEDTHYYVDIYMLCETIEDKEALDLMTTENEKYYEDLSLNRRGTASTNGCCSNGNRGQGIKNNNFPTVGSRTKGATYDGHRFLQFEDIKDQVNGYGRIVYYKSNSSNPDPQYNELEKVEEGRFLRGQKDGYCRSISAINGQCAAGFHYADVPKGKWCLYQADGQFALPQGIYEGSHLQNKIELTSFNEMVVRGASTLQRELK